MPSTTSTPPTGTAYSEIATPNGPQYQAMSGATPPTPGGSNQSTYVGMDGNVYNSLGQKMGSAGVPTGQVPNGSYNPTQLSANFINPQSQTTSAPIVLNAKPATDFLNNVGAQIQKVNGDVQNQSQTLAQQSLGSQPQTQDQQQGETSNQTQDQQTQTGATPDPAAQLNDQISAILANLGQGEQNIDSQINNAQTSNNEGNSTSFYNAELENQMQEAQQYQQYAGILSQIQSGTYPLSAPEQQLLSSTQNQFSQAIQQQQIANQAYTGQMAEAMASLGINQTAPTEAMGNIYGAISTGQSKIAALDTQMAQSLSTMQLAFQKQDYDMVQQEWQNTSTQFENRQNSLATMQKQVSDALEQQKSDLQSYATTALSAINNSANFSLTEKQDLIKNAQAQQQIDESQRHDLVQEAIDTQNSLKGVYTFEASTGQVFDTRTGQVVGQTQNGLVNGTITPGNTGVPIVDSNTRTTQSGVPYVDGTTLTGAQASQAQLQAAQLGIPYLGSAGAGALNKLEEARQNISNIKDVLTGAAGGTNISPSNALSRLLEIPNYAAEGVTQSGPEAAQLAAYNTFRSAAIGALQAVAGGSGSGLRINQSEIEMSINNDIPTPTDTAEVRDQKIANMTSLLDSNEAQLLGTQVWAKYNPNSPTALQSSALDQLVGSSGNTAQPAGTQSLNNLSQQFGI